MINSVIIYLHLKLKPNLEKKGFAPFHRLPYGGNVASKP